MWFAFAVYELGIIGLVGGLFPHPLVDPLHLLLNIAFFYLHAEFTLPFLLKNKNRIIYFLVPALIFQLCAYILVHFTLDKILIALEVIKLNKVYVLNLNVVSRTLYRAVYFFGFSTGYYFIKTYIAERKKTEQLEKERLENIIQQQKMAKELVLAENAFLKAQINPHFLFNTLDFIHYKVSSHSAVAGEAIIKLAEMMRFAIDADDTGNHIAMANEIEQLENLIYLYQIRKSAPLHIYFSYTNEVRHLRLIPLVLLTLAENIFKYADIYNDNDPAYLNLKVVDDIFYLDTGNRIALHKASPSNQSGLSNIKKRLLYAYGDAAIFNHHITHTHFSLSIKVPVSLLVMKN